MIHDARLRMAEILSQITGRTFEVNNESEGIAERWIDTGRGGERCNILSDKEALDRLVKETGEVSRLLARAYQLMLLICQDDNQNIGL